MQCFPLLSARISDSDLLVCISDPDLPFPTTISRPVSGPCFQSPFPVPIVFPVSDSVSFPVTFPVLFPVSGSFPFPGLFHISDSVPFPIQFYISDSIPQFSILNRLPFRFPFQIPFLSGIPRGSTSLCISLCSCAALLYIEGST